MPDTLFGLNIVHVFHTRATETLMTLQRPLSKHRASITAVRLGGGSILKSYGFWSLYIANRFTISIPEKKD